MCLGQALSKETTTLYRYFVHFSNELLTPKFEGAVVFVRSLLTPAVGHTDALARIIEAQPYFDHMLELPRTILQRLSTAAAASIEAVPRLEALAPTAEHLNLATSNVFEALSPLQADLFDLLLPNSTCLADASCQTSVQIRVRAMRTSARELQRRLLTVSRLTDALKGPLATFLDHSDLASILLPDIEVLGAWTRALSGQTPQLAGSTRSPLAQQLLRAMCKEHALRETQGRSAAMPLWFDSASCAAIDARLVDGYSFVVDALDKSHKAAPLFSKLVSAMRSFNEDIGRGLVTFTALVDSADGSAYSLTAHTEVFASSFVNVSRSFTEVGEYLTNAAPIFELEDAIVQLEAAVSEVSTTAQLRELSYSATGALRHFSEASAPPFGCTNVPLDCEAALGSVPQIEASAAELAWDVQRAPGEVVPMVLLTGLGDGLCYLRAAGEHVREVLNELTQPLEKLIEFYVQGPAALRGEAPQCSEDDPYCLAVVPRANILYRLIGFPIFYLHFWSLGTPPPANPCRFVMVRTCDIELRALG